MYICVKSDLVCTQLYHSSVISPKGSVVLSERYRPCWGNAVRSQKIVDCFNSCFVERGKLQKPLRYYWQNILNSVVRKYCI